jgi:predicted nucleotidyltransferase
MKFHSIELPQDKITAFCRKWKVVELALFGSVLREDFGPESDIDILISFQPDAP